MTRHVLVLAAAWTTLVSTAAYAQTQPVPEPGLAGLFAGAAILAIAVARRFRK